MEEEDKNKNRHLVLGAVWGGVVGLPISLFFSFLQDVLFMKITYFTFILLFFILLGSVIGYLKNYKNIKGFIFRGVFYGLFIGSIPLILLTGYRDVNVQLMILSVLFALLFFIIFGGVVGYLNYYSNRASLILGIIVGIVFGVIILMIPKLHYIIYPFFYMDKIFRTAANCEECWFIGYSFLFYYIFFWSVVGIAISTLLKRIWGKRKFHL